MATNAISSTTNSTDQLLLQRQAQRSEETARAAADEAAKPKPAKQQEPQPAEQPRPVTNTQGQRIGTVVNITV